MPRISLLFSGTSMCITKVQQMDGHKGEPCLVSRRLFGSKFGSNSSFLRRFLGVFFSLLTGVDQPAVSTPCMPWQHHHTTFA